MSEYTVNVGVRTEDHSTGIREAKDIIKAIKTGVSTLLMRRQAPGKVAVDMVSADNKVKGTVTLTPQPSQATGRFMYYMTGTIDIGPFKGLDWTGNVQLPEKDPSNFLDDDSLMLYQAAKQAQGSEKEIAKLTADQIALLAKHGVTVKRSK